MSYHVVVLTPTWAHVMNADRLGDANLKGAAVLCAFEGLYPVSILGPDGEWRSVNGPLAMPRSIGPGHPQT